MQYKYIVWVGGVDDYYTDLDRAIEDFREWIEKGYDEVAIECIGRKEECYESIRTNRQTKRA